MEIDVPLDGAWPGGDDLRYSAEYEVIRTARERLHDNLPAGLWSRVPASLGSWAAQVNRCGDFLARRSKDLQVLGWWVEARYHDQGLVGLEEGLGTYVRALVSLWAHLHPRVDPDDDELREAPIRWLLDRVVLWIDALPEATQAQAVQWQRFQASVEQLGAFLDEVLPAGALGTQPLLRRLAACQFSATESLPPSDVQEGPALLPLSGGMAAGDVTPGESLTGRDQAYEQIARIAAFLSEVEPHSPTPMVLRAIGDWRNKTFSELMERWPVSGPSVYDLIRVLCDSTSRS